MATVNRSAIATTSRDARRQSLAERGLARPPKIEPTAKLVNELPPAPTLSSGTSLVQNVLDEREEGW